MRLTTAYAPPTYLKPCLVVDTVFSSRERETAVRWVQALDANHALAFGGDHPPKASGWIVIQRHQSRDAAIAYHIELTATFCNGGSDEEWESGYPAYLALWERWGEAEMEGTS